MTKNSNSRFSLRTIVLIFIGFFIAGALFLFHPVLECINDFGGYAEACDTAFHFFQFRFRFFATLWMVDFLVAVVVDVSKRKK